MVVLAYVGALAYGAICLLASLIIYKLGVPKRYTRKIVHILVGAEWFILYHTVGAGIHFVAVCLIFTVLVWISYAKSLMPMISSDNDNAPGTVYYCISMTIMAIVGSFVPDFMLPFGIAVLCTSLGDGLAAVIGSSVSRANPKIYGNKTLWGSVSAFVMSAVSVYIFTVSYGMSMTAIDALFIAAFAAGLELITGFGLDNVTIPLGTAFFAYLLRSYDFIDHYTVPIVVTPFIIALALGKGILTKKAVVYAIICDAAVSVALGNFGFTLLLSFLLLSVLIDKIKKRFKQADDISAKGDNRDEVQVIANGAISVAMALLFLLSGEKLFVIGYCAALAECFADTCASGIGMSASSAFDLFKMRRVPKGLSGGMSWQGTVASLIAPFVFSLIPLAFGIIGISDLLIVALTAFIGAVFDSMLGSLLQAKFKCTECSGITEKHIHCNVPTEHVSGLKLINNDVVNVLSSAFAAVIAMVLFILIK